MASIATWKVRVPAAVEFGADKVDCVLTIKRASLEEREAFAELRAESARHARDFSAFLVPGPDGKPPKKPTKKQEDKLHADGAALAARMKTQVIAHVIGVEGVEIETAPGESSAPGDGASLIAAFGGEAPVVGSIWRAVADAQFITPALGEASAATPAS